MPHPLRATCTVKPWQHSLCDFEETFSPCITGRSVKICKFCGPCDERQDSYEGAKPWHNLRRKRGVEVIELAADELRQLEPALAPIFFKGVFLPNSVQTLNPYKLTSALAEAFVRSGGEQPA